MWIVIAIVLIAVALLLIPAMYFGAKALQKREPYATVLKLRTRQKLRFFRLALSDSRVPRRVKLIPLFLVLYLLMPIDIIPDFIPVLGYLDDVALIAAALALMIKLMPRDVVMDLIQEAAS